MLFETIGSMIPRLHFCQQDRGTDVFAGLMLARPFSPMLLTDLGHPSKVPQIWNDPYLSLVIDR